MGHRQPRRRSANGTTRTAIRPQNVVAVAGFQTGRAVPWRLSVRLALPAVLGGVGGAMLAARLDPGPMRVALAAGVVFVAVTALVKPPRTPRLKSPWSEIVFFGVGLYLGFLQVGVGFLLLACLAGGLGLDLVRANAAKVLIVLIVTVPTLAVFGWTGQLWWREGLVLAAGNMGGAWIAARLSLKKPGAWIRWVIILGAAAAVVSLFVKG